MLANFNVSLETESCGYATGTISNCLESRWHGGGNKEGDEGSIPTNRTSSMRASRPIASRRTLHRPQSESVNIVAGGQVFNSWNWQHLGRGWRWAERSSRSQPRIVCVPHPIDILAQDQIGTAGSVLCCRACAVAVCTSALPPHPSYIGVVCSCSDSVSYVVDGSCQAHGKQCCFQQGCSACWPCSSATGDDRGSFARSSALHLRESSHRGGAPGVYTLRSLWGAWWELAFAAHTPYVTLHSTAYGKGGCEAAGSAMTRSDEFAGVRNPLVGPDWARPWVKEFELIQI